MLYATYYGIGSHANGEDNDLTVSSFVDVESSAIIDFELWREVGNSALADRSKELQRWGLVESKRPKDWFEAWAMQER